MDLQDIVAQEQFADYYEQNNLRTPEEKIGKLREVMKIIGIRCERGRKPEEILAILEESALLGYWRAT